MLDLSSTPDEFLHPIDHVLQTALPHTRDLRPDDVLVVGAWCRDVLHHALGHRFVTTATQDLDLALALRSWDSFRALAAAFPRVGDTGIRFRIADVTVDLIPFGDIEDPTGTTTPPTRREPFSVWAFDEIFAASSPLPLPSGAAIRIPTIAGFTAAKLGAWLDRCANHETKDARDLALAHYWYSQADGVTDRLYTTEPGNDALLAEAVDMPRAAARLLGTDVASTIGALRLDELLARWPGDLDLLARNFGAPGIPMLDESRRRAVIAALTAGLGS